VANVFYRFTDGDQNLSKSGNLTGQCLLAAMLPEEALETTGGSNECQFFVECC